VILATSAIVDGLIGAGVLALIVVLALVVGWRRDKRTRSVRAGVFLERELYTDAELDATEPEPPEPRQRPVD
jgi:ABC-type lipoprotein release transport system permease subunit